MDVEIVSATKILSPTFYILLLIAIAIIVSIIFLIKKLNYNFKEFLKSAKISLLITTIINIFLLIISFFLPQPTCKIGAHCSSSAGMLISLSLYIIPVIFLIVLLIYLVIKAVKNN